MVNRVCYTKHGRIVGHCAACYIRSISGYLSEGLASASWLQQAPRLKRFRGPRLCDVLGALIDTATAQHGTVMHVSKGRRWRTTADGEDTTADGKDTTADGKDTTADGKEAAFDSGDRDRRVWSRKSLSCRRACSNTLQRYFTPGLQGHWSHSE